MIVALPEIIKDPKYKDAWEFDGWKPKAKANAPDEVKKAIADWEKDVEAADSLLSSEIENRDR